MFLKGVYHKADKATKLMSESEVSTHNPEVQLSFFSVQILQSRSLSVSVIADAWTEREYFGYVVKKLYFFNMFTKDSMGASRRFFLKARRLIWFVFSAAQVGGTELVWLSKEGAAINFSVHFDSK